MHLRRLGLGALVGFAVACGGSEFTSGAPDVGAGGASTTGSSTGTSAATGTVTGTTTGSTATTGATTSGGGDPTTGTSGSSGPGPGTTTGGGGSGGSGGAGTTTSSGSAGKGGAGGSSGGSAGRGGSGGSTGGSGAGGGGSGGSGGMNGTGGSAGSRDAGTDGGLVDCMVLRTDVDQKLAAAQKCDPKAMVAQCQDTVEGLCCAKVPVTSQMSAETQAYLAALEKYKAAHCLTACPLIICPMGPATCMANPDGAGRCTAGPGPLQP